MRFLEFAPGEKCTRGDEAHTWCLHCNDCGRFDADGDRSPERMGAITRQLERSAPAPLQNPLARRARHFRIDQRLLAKEAADALGMKPGEYVDFENSRRKLKWRERRRVKAWLKGRAA